MHSCCWKQFYVSLDQSVQQEVLLYNCKQFYASLNNLCYRECFWLTTLGWNSNLNFPAKICTGMYRALLCGDDSSQSQSQSGKRLLLASKGHPMRTLLYHGSCIDPTHQSHTLDLTSEAPILRNPVPIQLLIKDNCWQKLHFEYSRQNLNRNVHSPSMWWWLITQPRPIWRKAPPGLQRPN